MMKTDNEQIDKALQRAFEKKKDFKDLVYIWLAEVAIISILAAAIFF
jgi:hypothetical protein